MQQTFVLSQNPRNKPQSHFSGSPSCPENKKTDLFILQCQGETKERLEGARQGMCVLRVHSWSVLSTACLQKHGGEEGRCTPRRREPGCPSADAGRFCCSQGSRSSSQRPHGSSSKSRAAVVSLHLDALLRGSQFRACSLGPAGLAEGKLSPVTVRGCLL